MKSRLSTTTPALFYGATALSGLLAVWTAPARGQERLPNTAPLEWQGDLSERMMDGLHRFIEAKIEQAIDEPGNGWRPDTTSPEAYEASLAPKRERLAKVLGVVDSRLPARMERFGDDSSPALVAETDRYRVYQVRWPVLEGVTGEGLLLEPLTPPVAQVVALPDADQTPEQLAGLAEGIAVESQFARRLAENGWRVVVPVLIDRNDEWSGNPDVAWTNQPHREWIYRQAYQMGRHPIGYEVQKTLAAVDWFTKRDGELAVAVAGYGEGGLIALCSAALDTRIEACLTSGYFETHALPWEEPLYRNVWGWTRDFGDAVLAAMIAPRTLIVEYSRAPEVTGPPAARPGRRQCAAAGRLVTPTFADVATEFERIDEFDPNQMQARLLLSGETANFGSDEAMGMFGGLFGIVGPLRPAADPRVSTEPPRDLRTGFSPAERQRRQVQELERHVQQLVRGAARTRERFAQALAPVEPRSLESHVAQAPKLRQYLWDEVLGRFDDAVLPPRPRSRLVYDREKWTGYEVVLDVFPDVFAWGVLLLPKDLRPGERRPVVVCQHGRNGVPADVIEGDQAAYHDFAARLADEGFIVFAPHNPYRGEDRYRFLSRKANAVGASLFSFILAQHQQILDWLAELPMVDAERIAFYGLSYGGETAVRVPPLLEGYCLSICSADFNDWARKVASTEAALCFPFTIEWEMPYFDMGGTFNYAEMAALMAPRPFMVERGHDDGVAPDEWVAYEYAKVRRLYDRLGIGDQTEIEFFDGGHTINGQGTFRFLRRHLRFPDGSAAEDESQE